MTEISNELLFSASLMSPVAKAALPPHHRLRPLSTRDYDLGFMQCLSHLTEVNPHSKESFMERFSYMRAHNHEYHVLVVVKLCPKSGEELKIVASGTVFLERKFIRGSAICAHIEDIVSHPEARGLRLGWIIIEALKHVAKERGAYKVILDCDDKNVGFYNKCGFTQKEVEMVWYVPGRDTRAKL